MNDNDDSNGTVPKQTPNPRPDPAENADPAGLVCLSHDS